MSAAPYEIRVRGRLSRELLERFEEMECAPGRVDTVLHGRVRDQSELHGLLDRIQALGLELVALRRLPGVTETPPHPARVMPAHPRRS